MRTHYTIGRAHGGSFYLECFWEIFHKKAAMQLVINTGGGDGGVARFPTIILRSVGNFVNIYLLLNERDKFVTIPSLQWSL